MQSLASKAGWRPSASTCSVLRHELWCAEVWSNDQGSASLQVQRPLALVPVLSTDCHRPPHLTLSAQNARLPAESPRLPAGEPTAAGVRLVWACAHVRPASLLPTDTEKRTRTMPVRCVPNSLSSRSRATPSTLAVGPRRVGLVDLSPTQRVPPYSSRIHATAVMHDAGCRLNPGRSEPYRMSAEFSHARCP